MAGQIHLTSSGALEALDVILNKFRTARTQHTVTSGEASAGVCSIVLNWGTAFPDTNYTVSLATAIVSGSKDQYAINSFTVAAGQITVSVAVKGSAGDVVVLHGLGIHD